MDYLKWELERQRAALTALLLGGGEDGGTALREEKRRSPGVPDAAGKRAAGDAGRYAEPPGGDWSPENKFPEGRKAGRNTGTAELGAAGAGTPEISLNARERRSASKDGPFAGTDQNVETDVPVSFVKAPRVRLGGEAGAQPDLPGSFAEHRTQRGGQEVPAGHAGARSQAAGYAGGGGSGSTRMRQPAAVRRSNWTVAGAEDRYGLPVLQETVGGGPWGGGRGPAVQRAEDGAKALSRAVQRDARRYDGGFNIY